MAETDASAWRCTACRETVPGTLGLCWSCSAPRPEAPEPAGADGDENTSEPAPAGPRVAAPAQTSSERVSLGAELGVVVLLFAAWRVLDPLLERMGQLPPVAEWPPFGRAFYELMFLAQALAMLWLVRRWRGEPAAEFGLVRPRVGDLFLGAAVFVALLLADLLVRWWTRTGWSLPTGPPQLGADAVDGFHALVGIVAGAAHEEIVWRGYALTRLVRLTESPGIAVVLSSLLFGALHLHYESFQVFSMVVMGVITALAFLRWRRLGPVIVAHVLWNVYATAWD